VVIFYAHVRASWSARHLMNFWLHRLGCEVTHRHHSKSLGIGGRPLEAPYKVSDRGSWASLLPDESEKIWYWLRSHSPSVITCHFISPKNWSLSRSEKNFYCPADCSRFTIEASYGILRTQKGMEIKQLIKEGIESDSGLRQGNSPCLKNWNNFMVWDNNWNDAAWKLNRIEWN